MRAINSISRLVEIGLRLTGIWPGSPYGILLRFTWMVMMGMAQVFQYWYLTVHFSFNDLSNVVDAISTTLPYSLFFIKLNIFWYNRGLFNKILAVMSEDWSHSTQTDFTLSVMTNKATLSDRCSKLIIGIYAMAAGSYAFTSMQGIYKAWFGDIDVQSRALLLKMEFPFVSQVSPIYEFVMLVQVLQLVAVGSAIGTLDALMITLMLHIGGQIDIMRQTLASISSKHSNHGLPKSLINSLIHKHNRIIALSRSVNKLFTYIALLQFFSNTLIICCIGFVIVTSIGSSKNFDVLIKSIFFYIAITLEAFVFCFSGEYLSSKSKKIADAAYESVWYALKPNDSRVILFLIMRSQKQLTISAGKFQELSLESFLSILRASASYVSVLNAFY